MRRRDRAGHGRHQTLTARAALAAPGRRGQRLVAPDNGGYGPIGPVADTTTGRPLLHRPAGFEYASFGHSATYAASPRPAHDGIRRPPHARPARRHGRLPDRHRRRRPTRPEPRAGLQRHDPAPPAPTTPGLIGDRSDAYDQLAAGGTTTLTFDTRTMTLTDSFVSLNGTSVNCAGGATPWGTWLTCEETVNGRQNGFAEDHGYVFEVPAQGGPVANPAPKAMGRFAHEAVAVDPATGIVYETEDNGNTSGLYRCLPDAPDNICVSPCGGLVLCEDGDDRQYVRGLDERGQIFDLALNNISRDEDEELAGACFSPDGEVLFVNVQTPGVSFAVRGPWERGAL